MKNKRTLISQYDAKHRQIKSNGSEGITLVALVVTIVVLLILAGVTITMLFGENGIIKKAQEAKEATERDQQETEQGMQDLAGQISSVLNGEVIAPPGSLLAMYRQAVAETCDNAGGSCTNPNHLHIGDYVNYVEPTSGSYPVTSEKSGMKTSNSTTDYPITDDMEQTYTLSATKNNVNWRVLGIDKTTGGVKLIAADPIERDAIEGVSDPYLYLYGAEAYVNGPTEMDNICAMYLNPTYATKARSVTMDDIDEVTGIITEDQKKATNFWTVQGSSQLGTSYSFENQYTPERWIAKKAKEAEGNGETIEGTTISDEVTGYGYPVFKTQAEAEAAASELGSLTPVVLSNTRAYNMLFANTVDVPYWLASNGVVTLSGYAFFCPGEVLGWVALSCAFIDEHRCFYLSAGLGGQNCLAVRPVVVLKSDVLASAVPKIADQGSTWTYTPDTGE